MHGNGNTITKSVLNETTNRNVRHSGIENILTLESLSNSLTQGCIKMHVGKV